MKARALILWALRTESVLSFLFPACDLLGSMRFRFWRFLNLSRRVLPTGLTARSLVGISSGRRTSGASFCNLIFPSLLILSASFSSLSEASRLDACSRIFKMFSTSFLISPTRLICFSSFFSSFAAAWARRTSLCLACLFLSALVNFPFSFAAFDDALSSSLRPSSSSSSTDPWRSDSSGPPTSSGPTIVPFLVSSDRFTRCSPSSPIFSRKSLTFSSSSTSTAAAFLINSSCCPPSGLYEAPADTTSTGLILEGSGRMRAMCLLLLLGT
mmetsp:Transcript_30726/g.98841  ORF Transcript_30726/g.98841 Transcript_30726/m.98841 type:complete len:270 (-) Transcript_30726:472-1281(-)